MKLITVSLWLLIGHAIRVSSANPIGAGDKLVLTNDITHANDAHEPPEAQLSPIILLPGDGGSRLQAKLDRRDVSHHYCERKSSDWFDLWLNLSNLVPFAIDCWVDK